MSGWLSPGTLIGLATAGLFALVAYRDLPRAIYLFALLGAIPWVRVGAFAGNEEVQGLVLAEVLATVLVGVWLMRRGRAAWVAINAVPFNRWLLWLLTASILSLASGFAWVDHTVPHRHVKLAVSIGQLLLFAWAIGIYLVTADQVRSVEWVRRFRRVITLLAVPQVVMLLRPGTASYLSWSWYFGLVAAPLACARIGSERSLLRRAALAVIIVLPMLEGLRAGKAFLYVYVTVSVLVVLWVRARRAFVVSASALVVGAVVLAILPDPMMLLGPFQWLIDIERAQQSWGGRAGRLALAADAVAVWTGHPVLGVGPANSYPYMLRYSVIGTPHGQYVNLLVELGLVGAVLFVAFVAAVVRFGLRTVRVRRDRETDLFLLGWFASFVAWSVSSLAGDYMLHSIRNGGLEMFAGFYIHWVFLGAAVGISRVGAERVVAREGMPNRPSAWMPDLAMARPHSWAEGRL
jgi:O-antigen ligase